MRSKKFPRGLPWVKGRAAEGLKLGNLLADFSLRALHAQFQRNDDAAGLLEHPEDLGTVESGEWPGSIWHFDTTQALLELPRVQWGGLAQADFGAPYPKPTRFLGRMLTFDTVVNVGPPTHDGNGRYTGPIPKSSKPARKLGRTAADEFNTAKSAAYPPELCKAIAQAFIKLLQLTGKSLNMGETQLQVSEAARQEGVNPPAALHGLYLTLLLHRL